MIASRAAVAHEAGKPLSIETVNVDGPREGEVLIEIRATGICHTDAFTLSGDDPEGLLAEIMGKKEGICGGRGGSQHLHNGNFYSNGVLGNMFPVAAGMAFAEKVNTGNLVAIFIGDGTFGQGVIYETLNICSVLSIPLLVVIENNCYAQTTSINVGLELLVTLFICSSIDR